jgi:alkylhydroperoxidase family enzyme
MGRGARRASRRGAGRPEESGDLTAHIRDPFALHEGAAETWQFIADRVLDSGLVDRGVKELCFAYVDNPDGIDLEAYAGRERAALDWTYAIVWDADASTDQLWGRLGAYFTEPQLVELGCAIGFYLGRQHFLRTLGAA